MPALSPNEDDPAPRSGDGQIAPDQTEEETYRQFLIDHERRMLSLTNALSRVIELAALRLDIEASRNDLPFDAFHHIDDLRPMIRYSALALTDAVSDLPGRFYYDYYQELDSDAPDPLEFTAFSWVGSTVYGFLKRANFVVVRDYADGRIVYRQEPPRGPTLDDIISRTYKSKRPN